MLFYTSYGGKLYGVLPCFDTNNDNKITTLDIYANKLDYYLDQIECKDMVIILQPDYSGDWITDLKQEAGSPVVPEKNRVILTSEQSGQTSDLDLCNMEPSESTKVDVYYIGTNSDDDPPTGDGEDYSYTLGDSWKYQVNKYEESPYEDLYEIDDVDEDPFILRFYENWKDEGAEFVSGIVDEPVNAAIEIPGHLGAGIDSPEAQQGVGTHLGRFARLRHQAFAKGDHDGVVLGKTAGQVPQRLGQGVGGNCISVLLDAVDAGLVEAGGLAPAAEEPRAESRDRRRHDEGPLQGATDEGDAFCDRVVVPLQLDVLQPQVESAEYGPRVKSPLGDAVAAIIVHEGPPVVSTLPWRLVRLNLGPRSLKR